MINSISTTLAIELALVAVVILLFLLFLFSRRRKVELQSIQQLISKSNESKAEKELAVGVMLADKYKLEGDELHQVRDDLIEGEKQFIKDFCLLKLEKDERYISEMDVRLTLLLSKYQNLRPVESGVDPEEIERIRREAEEKVKEKEAVIDGLNSELEQSREQVSSTMTSMDQIMNEYTMMYELDKDNPAQLKASMNRMLRIVDVAEKNIDVTSAAETVGESDASIE